ncbi:leukocyte tyrosine kinase receptor isoform X2 [Hyperolius riggenbachi]|uniref:leukocyte tyrosine kinase receptor isoform X2 n=1 Tax=Hyperolius riggenbachi TaxID=752182 RepID=UPI0035A3AF18
MIRIYQQLAGSTASMGFPFSVLIFQMLLWSLLLVADWCSGLHAESILTPGLPITGMSMSEAEEVAASFQHGIAGESCDFETPCPWTSSTSLDGNPHWVPTLVGELLPQDQMQLLRNMSGNLDDGLLLLNTSEFSNTCLVSQLLSPLFSESSQTCRLELVLYSPDESITQKLTVRMLDKKSNLSVALPPLKEDTTNQWSPWKMLTTEIGRMDNPFEISLDYALCYPKTETFIVIASLHLRNCFGSDGEVDVFSCPWESSFLCKNGECIGRMKVCDFQTDCPGGDDEGAVCEILPLGAHCTFEGGTCGWTASTTAGSSWTHTDSVQLIHKDHLGLTEGFFLYLPVESEWNESAASVQSDYFPPVVPNKTCQFSLKFLIFGTFNGTLVVYALEDNTGTSQVKLWQKDESDNGFWSSAVFKVPHFNNRFCMQLVATWGKSSFSHILIDNITFSADCFNSGRTESSSAEQEGPHETDPWEDEILSPLPKPEEEEDIYWWFSTCGAKGPYGPTQAQCNNAYRNTNVSVLVGKEGPVKGVQIWRVPFTKVYKISAYGAAGGKGAKNHNKRSYGIFMSGVFNLEKDELLYIVVGQQGEDACPGGNNRTQEICKGALSVIEDEHRENNSSLSTWAGGGGGGGGATYVFKEVNGVFLPLLVGAGGGGKSYLQDPGDSSSYEQEETYERDMEVPGLNGHSGAAGGGGGWSDTTLLPWSGKSLLEGAEGGQSCYQAKSSLQWDTHGGFGGGGGPCTSGGGGGGYQGGHTSQLDDVSADGQDGVSFINSFGEIFVQPLAAMENDGEVHIDFYLNCSHCKSGSCRKEIERKVICLCEAGTMLANDNVTCIEPKGPIPDRQLPLPLILGVLIATVILGILFAFGSLSFVYHRKKKQLEGARVRLQSTEYKLSKIRSSIIMTDYNPNYCFAGKGAGLSELKEVPRKNITLLRALGHGAFGEVYEGLVVGISGDPNPLQVAIKTLPEICSEQDEMDFLMEALIISKFSHQNIVRCIGVSLQTLPRFILLELMSGGDMKSFLRHNRPWVNQPSSLTMSDLLNMARDIACGCKYLEENHFIHRDIAARNCLLTRSSSGRVAKIGDFGMARDIYRASYYRKGGRAMLPVKWMPPEAFLEGIFTSKTDSWSFGVLLWEIFSLGYMPYPCKTNQEVLEFVTSGGRMDPPKNCPGPVYRIMTQCWQHTPDHRPNFSTILERIIYCTQDPDVINTELPVESGPAPEDEGSTIMRPTSCNGMTPLIGNPSLPAMLDTQTMEHKLADIPEELRVENLVGWSLRAPSLQCAGETPEVSWAPSNPISSTETKPQMSHKLKNKSKNLWNPTYGSWVMESTC